MKRTALLILVLAMLYPATTNAQTWRMKRYEGIFGIGTSHYFGDIGGYSKGENALGFKDFSISSTRPSIYLGARYKVYEVLAVKLNLITGFLSGSDEGGVNEGRNYKFSATIFEPSIQAEFSFLREQEARSYLMMKGKGMRTFRSSISAYAFAGIGGGFFWPKAKENLESVELDYNKATLVVPMGLGAKYGLNSNWSIGFELGLRLTTTDYLDAYTSPHSKSNDIYYFAVINGVYKIRTSRSGWPMFGR
jgi:hypothetical protein